MLRFDRKVLERHGLRIQETSEGFMILAEEHLPDSVLTALRNVARDVSLDVDDCDRLIGMVADMTMWAAAKRAAHDAMFEPNLRETHVHRAFDDGIEVAEYTETKKARKG